MIDKEICKRCYLEQRWHWGKAEELTWNKCKKVICPILIIDDSDDSPSLHVQDIDGCNLHKKCYYRLEQIVIGQKELEK